MRLLQYQVGVAPDTKDPHLISGGHKHSALKGQTPFSTRCYPTLVLKRGHRYQVKTPRILMLPTLCLHLARSIFGLHVYYLPRSPSNHILFLNLSFSHISLSHLQCVVAGLLASGLPTVGVCAASLHANAGSQRPVGRLLTCGHGHELRSAHAWRPRPRGTRGLRHSDLGRGAPDVGSKRFMLF